MYFPIFFFVYTYTYTSQVRRQRKAKAKYVRAVKGVYSSVPPPPALYPEPCVTPPPTSTILPSCPQPTMAPSLSLRTGDDDTHDHRPDARVAAGMEGNRAVREASPGVAADEAVRETEA